MRVLSVQYNKIDELPDLRLPNLRELELTHNLISNVGEMTKLKNLQLLNLSQNRIKSFKEFSFMPELTELNLEDNCIEKISNMRQFPNLTTLSLGKNPLESIGKNDFPTNESIRNLSLRYCMIKSYKHLTALPNLEELDVTGNIKLSAFK